MLEKSGPKTLERPVIQNTFIQACLTGARAKLLKVALQKQEWTHPKQCIQNLFIFHILLQPYAKILDIPMMTKRQSDKN